jgi:hypothetical protein
MARTEAMSIKEFMNRGREPIFEVSKMNTKEAFHMGMLLPMATGLPLAISKTVHAQETVTVMAAGDMYTKMMVAFDPLIELVQALAYPVAMIVVLGGSLFVMIGNKEKGFSMMQGAGLGVVLVQIAPMILNILIDAVKTSV